MRFMIIVKTDQRSEAGMPLAGESPEVDRKFAEMTDYHEELAEAGVLLDASGLQPTAKGWRVRYDGDERTVVDGPFAEAKELIGGYTIIQVGSREEAEEWVRRFPNPALDDGEAEIEVRQLYELDDFGESPEIDRFRELELPGQR